MKCPVDETTLQMSERGGVEIDYCPTCRGVWLDRGELDKIIAKSIEADAQPQATAAAAPQAAPPPQGQPGAPWGAPPPQPYGHQPYGHGYGHKPYKRRKSFLEELFD
jgi:Zn-finger nucleic acid-binding protein